MLPQALPGALKGLWDAAWMPKVPEGSLSGQSRCLVTQCP